MKKYWWSDNNYNLVNHGSGDLVWRLLISMLVEYMQMPMFPHDISPQGKGVNGQQIDQVLTEFAQEPELISD